MKGEGVHARKASGLAGLLIVVMSIAIASPAQATVSFSYPLSAPFAGATASRAIPKPQIGSAYVYTFKHQEESDGYCTGGSAGIIRWPAVKGVDAYTVVFNDGAYGGAEQRIPVAADAEGNWPGDKPPEGETYPDANAPKGEHQMGWTGGAYFGPGPCQPDTADYSSRLTNAHTEYFREGEYIDGTVKGPCEDDGCPPTPGVKVTANGSGGGSDTTDSAGKYSIKVKKGSYTVTPSKGDFKFGPKSKRVSVRTNSTATANFTVAGGPAKLDISVVPKQSPINVSDSPEESGPAQTTVDVTVRNHGKGTAEGVVLKNLGIEWDVDGVQAPKPLPLAQIGPPSVAEMGDIAPGESLTSQFLVEATGDGTFKLTGEATGKDFKGPVKGEGTARIKSQSPLLFIYTRPEQSVPSPDAPELIKAGTALSMRVRLQNRSYKETLAVLPFTVGLEGNLLGGYLQKAGAPIQGPDQIDDIEMVYRANNVVVLEPRESRLLDAVFRTTYSNPTAAEVGGGTRGAANFPKPDTRIYNPKTGKLTPVDPEKVAFSAGSEHHEFSIDDRPPDAVPFTGAFDTAGAFGAFTIGALKGVAYSVAGTIRGIVVDLPQMIGTGAQAYVQLVTEREAELWKAVQESKSAHEAFDQYVQKQFEFMLRDFDAVGKVPGALKGALDGFDKASQEHLDKLANEWEAGNWVEAAQELGQDTGQLAGDIGLADVVLAKALAALPRLNKVVKAAEAAKTAAVSKLKPIVSTFTAKAQSAVRAMKFISKRLKPGFVADFEALQTLYGLSHAQARFLAVLSKTEGILIAVRSRGSGALKWIEDFAAYVKPEWIKIKNVSHYDVEFLGYNAADLDRVVIKRDLPSELEVAERMTAAGVDDLEVRREVFERLKARNKELVTDEPGYVKWIEERAATGTEVTSNFNWADNGLDPYAKGKKTQARFVIADDPPPGNLMVSIDGGPPRPVTGDIDLVGLTKADGTPLSNAVHERILNILAGPPLYIQHPETSTWFKNGVFDFPAKLAELAKDLPIQFAPDGLARVVKFKEGLSFFKSKLNYFVHWEGGYRHLDWLKLPGLPATP
jgi:hypothetical protein